MNMRHEPNCVYCWYILFCAQCCNKSSTRRNPNYMIIFEEDEMEEILVVMNVSLLLGEGLHILYLIYISKYLRKTLKSCFLVDYYPEISCVDS